MGKARDRLVDAARRLIVAGTSESEAVKSITEIGLGKAEAKSIVAEAKALAAREGPPQKSGQQSASANFWDAPVGSYFGDLHGGAYVNKSKGLLSFFRWFAK